jgi:hypothetical protein
VILRVFQGKKFLCVYRDRIELRIAFLYFMFMDFARSRTANEDALLDSIHYRVYIYSVDKSNKNA